jgi:hypothetical protein
VAITLGLDEAYLRLDVSGTQRVKEVMGWRIEVCGTETESKSAPMFRFAICELDLGAEHERYIVRSLTDSRKHALNIAIEISNDEPKDIIVIVDLGRQKRYGAWMNGQRDLLRTQRRRWFRWMGR